MSETNRRERMRALKKRSAANTHPKHPRLVAGLTDAPAEVAEVHALAERAVDTTVDLAAQLKQARDSEYAAPAEDAAAMKRSIEAGTKRPRPTAGKAEEKAAELHEQLTMAKQVRDEALDRLDVTIEQHASEWLAPRLERLQAVGAKRAAADAEAVEEWLRIDADYAACKWLHHFDAKRPNRPTGGLTDQGLVPAVAHQRLGRLAEQAADLATEGTPARVERKQQRDADKAKRAAQRQRRDRATARTS